MYITKSKVPIFAAIRHFLSGLEIKGVLSISQRVKAVVDLSKIRQNAALVKSFCGVKLCAVVKADAYGHGAAAVANALNLTADCFAVALTCEGQELRFCGIDKDILLLLPENYDAARAVEHSLTLTVESERQVKIIESACKKLGKRAAVHIKYNSGMNRLGCDLEQLKKLIQIILDSRYVDLEGVYSHLGAPQIDEILNRQYDDFYKAQAYVKQQKPSVCAHLSASGGILRGKKYNFDMVRCGIMLYGYKPFLSRNLHLKKALKIKAESLGTRRLLGGENYLYGDFTAKSGAYSLIRLGYADGLFRKQSALTVNNRCMDVSGASGVFDSYTISDFEKVAEEYGTITYEVLCSVTKRAQFEYLN